MTALAHTRCSVCRRGHDERGVIEQAAVDGQPVRLIARAHSISESSLRRHLAGHLAPELREIAAQRDQLRSSSLVSRLVEMSDYAAAVRAAALELGQGRTVLASIDTERGVIAVLLDKLGISDATIATDLAEAHQFTRALLHVMASHPEVGELVADALGSWDETGLAANLRTRARQERARIAAAAPLRAIDNGAAS